MPTEKYDPSPRILRRVLAVWIVALALLAVAALVWVVDPGQRTVLIGWAVAGAVLLGLVIPTLPDSPARPLRKAIPRDQRKQELWRMWPVYVIPSLVYPLGRGLMPGRPGLWVQIGGSVGAMSAGVGLAVLLVRWRARRLSAR